MRRRADLSAFVLSWGLGCGGASVVSPFEADGAGGGDNGGQGVSVLGSSGSAPDGGAGLGPFLPGFGPTVQVAPGTVACGTVTCNAATEVCCVPSFTPGGRTTLGCTPPGECQTGGALSCSSAASCLGSEVCCFSAGLGSADPVAGGSAKCENACSAGQTQLCTASAECPSSETCQETGGDLPQVCRNAPASNGSAGCEPSAIGGVTGSYGGVGECTVTLTATCGSATYEATCACPQGTCACFGPSTRVVDFAGCPFCPGMGSVGPTTAEHIFDLCGFPQ